MISGAGAAWKHAGSEILAHSELQLLYSIYLRPDLFERKKSWMDWLVSSPSCSSRDICTVYNSEQNSFVLISQYIFAHFVQNSVQASTSVTD